MSGADLLALPGITPPPPPGARREADFYPTPAWCVRAVLPLLQRLNLPASAQVLEPAGGDGAIIKVLLDQGFAQHEQISAIDIRPEAAAACCALGIDAQTADFLSWAPPAAPDLIITNPPFCRAIEFAQHALNVVAEHGTVAMLLRLAFMETPTRGAWLREHPVDVAVLPSRPVFVPDKRGRMAGSQDAYAWFLWQRGFRGLGTIHYLTGEGGLTMTRSNVIIWSNARRRLTKHERQWVERLAKHLAQTPDTLHLATSGDGLLVWDAAIDDEVSANFGDTCDGAIERAGGLLASMHHPNIQGVSG